MLVFQPSSRAKNVLFQIKLVTESSKEPFEKVLTGSDSVYVG